MSSRAAAGRKRLANAGSGPSSPAPPSTKSSKGLSSPLSSTLKAITSSGTSKHSNPSTPPASSLSSSPSGPPEVILKVYTGNPNAREPFSTSTIPVTARDNNRPIPSARPSPNLASHDVQRGETVPRPETPSYGVGLARSQGSYPGSDRIVETSRWQNRPQSPSPLNSPPTATSQGSWTRQEYNESRRNEFLERPASPSRGNPAQRYRSIPSPPSTTSSSGPGFGRASSPLQTEGAHSPPRYAPSPESPPVVDYMPYAQFTAQLASQYGAGSHRNGLVLGSIPEMNAPTKLNNSTLDSRPSTAASATSPQTHSISLAPQTETQSFYSTPSTRSSHSREHLHTRHSPSPLKLTPNNSAVTVDVSTSNTLTFATAPSSVGVSLPSQITPPSGLPARPPPHSTLSSIPQTSLSGTGTTSRNPTQSQRPNPVHIHSHAQTITVPIASPHSSSSSLLANPSVSRHSAISAATLSTHPPSSPTHSRSNSGSGSLLGSVHSGKSDGSHRVHRHPVDDLGPTSGMVQVHFREPPAPNTGRNGQGNPYALPANSKFVYPSSRSRATPSANDKGLLSFKLGKKKKVRSKKAGFGKGSNSSNVIEYPLQGAKESSSDVASLDEQPPFSADVQSLSSNASSAPAGFVFPNSRSRAVPSKAPSKMPKLRLGSKKGDKDKDKESLGSSSNSNSTSRGGGGGGHRIGTAHSESFSSPTSYSNPTSPESQLYLEEDVQDSVVDEESLAEYYIPSHGGAAPPVTQSPSNATGPPEVSPLTRTAQQRPSKAQAIVQAYQTNGTSSSTLIETTRSVPQPAQTRPPISRPPALDPYDSAVLESTRLSQILLGRLIAVLHPTSSASAHALAGVSPVAAYGNGNPSFYAYGTSPPAKVMDLGCGSGEWVIEAAVAWKGWGTTVVGVDIVDQTRFFVGMQPPGSSPGMSSVGLGVSNVAGGKGKWRAEAERCGVGDTVSFVKANFLTSPLPFEDDTFDLVRISLQTFTIPFRKWESVLQEVRRVLTAGGRVEIIDDHVFFPYGKPPDDSPEEDSDSDTNSEAPQIDVSIPSPRVSSIASMRSQRRAGGLRDLHEHDPEVSDTETLNGADDPRLAPSPPDITRTSTPQHSTSHSSVSPSRTAVNATSTSHSTASRTVSMIRSPSPEQLSPFDEWSAAHATSTDLESLFEHMMNTKYEIHLCPSEFLLELLQRVFGHSREVGTMHLTLPSPTSRPGTSDPRHNGDTASGSNRNGKLAEVSQPVASTSTIVDQTDSNPLSQCGLILWPSTYIPLTNIEVQAHAMRHPRVLLGCKTALRAHALELGITGSGAREQDDDESNAQADEDAIMEAFWEYETFLQQRFNPPSRGHLPAFHTSGNGPSTTGLSSVTEDTVGNGTVRPPSERSMHSRRTSLFSTYSMSSEGHSALWEYQFDLRHRFAWPLEDGERATSPGITVPRNTPQHSASSSQVPLPSAEQSVPYAEQTPVPSPPLPPPPPPTGRSHSFSVSSGGAPPSFVSTRPHSIAPPPYYSRFEPAHVRTFHIYEAIKMDLSFLSSEFEGEM